MKKQIKSSSGAAMDCIAEGFEQGQKNEFVYFLGISKGSTGEVRSQAYPALAWDHIAEDERHELDKLAWRTGAALQKLIEYLNTTPKGGQHFAKPTSTREPSLLFPTEPPPYLK